MMQTSYVDKLAKRLNIIPFKKTYEPMKVGEVIVVPHETGQDNVKNETLKVPYRTLVGCLLFLARHTRPDIMYAVTTLSKYCNNYNVQTA
jgi:hypothetical protein